MKFYLTKLVTNQQGQDSPSVSVYETKEAALVAYHQILAAYHNAPDVLHAIVQIANYEGNIEIMEIVEHPVVTPEPEPDENE